ncbi:lipid droplet-associated protein [[Mycobacterium] nativiensis]|uniref:Lipid droplet-associated protein n=1 Tax=[Mycobacterium] nativiensis TaxID=2855503 RepID=A0ABU5XU87_9MYCO|nr:lipid droplet-associated protein [Mycolicibacter sp. MYC340]MEB3031498.1 lipid droplet-associated protein [Mycolicibacter sp. MYC340]
MANAPFGVRLLVGAATVAVEETIKLPQTILTYPMTLASQAAHAVMRWQQSIAELVNKGDSTLESIFPPKDEQPEWATFDEDADDDLNGADLDATFDEDPGQRSDGRFALYSFSEGGEDRPAPPAGAAPGPSKAAGSQVPTPDLVDELDYGNLTLAQLRARLASLSIDELETLLGYEEATKARAPFQTLLANRITRANTK